MKIVCLFLLSLFVSNCFSQKVDTFSIPSRLLKEQRKLIVYTPYQYDYDSTKKFEVIYVFDAQAREIFDMVQATTAFKSNNICPMIVVGIMSNDRNKDFLPPNQYKETYETFNGHLGNADTFMRFISDELVPYIDKNYRTLPKKIAVGHSNGGTFITYCLLQQPELFDAYIAIAPNFGYDKMQFVKRFQSFDVNALRSNKYFYTCDCEGYPEKGDWVTGRSQVQSILKSNAFNKKIRCECQRFADSENHYTVFQTGVLNGLKRYFNYQYFNADNLLSYYNILYSHKLINLTAQNTNQLGYNFFYMDKVNDALKILLWAHQLFPQDLNLFDSIGEMYQNLKQNEKAKEYYTLMDRKIEEQKNTLKAEDYQQLKKGVTERLHSLITNK